MKVLISEISLEALNWAVATCEGLTIYKDSMLNGYMREGWWVSGYYMDNNVWIQLKDLRYCSDWQKGGPIIEREKISIEPTAHSTWRAISETEAFGETPLIAAMRCYVASKLGDEIEVPDELA